MLSKYLKKAVAVMSSVMIFSFAIQAVSPSLVAKADSVSTQTTASAQEQQEAQAKQLTLNLLASSGKSVANLLDDAYTSKVKCHLRQEIHLQFQLMNLCRVYILNGLRWKAAIACYITEKSRKSRRKICFISILILERQLQNVQ